MRIPTAWSILVPMSAAPCDTWSAEAVRGLAPETNTALVHLVIVVVLVIAHADGEVDSREVAAVHTAVDDAVKRGTALGALFREGGREVVALVRSVSNGQTDAFVRRAAEVLPAAFGPAAREAFVADLRGLARTVAESSSGTGVLAAFRPKVSPEEEAALVLVDSLLARLARP